MPPSYKSVSILNRLLFCIENNNVFIENRHKNTQYNISYIVIIEDNHKNRLHSYIAVNSGLCSLYTIVNMQGIKSTLYNV